MRAVGDPAQHSAVEAGGMWAHLVRRYPTALPPSPRTAAKPPPRWPTSASPPPTTATDASPKPSPGSTPTNASSPPPPHADLLDHLAADWYVDRRHRRPALAHDRRAPPRTPRPQRPRPSPPTRRRHPHAATVSASAKPRSTSATKSSPAPRTATSAPPAVTATATSATAPPAPSPPSPANPADEDLIVDFADRGPIRIPHDWLTEPNPPRRRRRPRPRLRRHLPRRPRRHLPRRPHARHRHLHTPKPSTSGSPEAPTTPASTPSNATRPPSTPTRNSPASPTPARPSKRSPTHSPNPTRPTSPPSPTVAHLLAHLHSRPLRELEADTPARRTRCGHPLRAHRSPGRRITPEIHARTALAHAPPTRYPRTGTVPCAPRPLPRAMDITARTLRSRYLRLTLPMRNEPSTTQPTTP